MPWFFAIVESEHEFQNPTSEDKIRLLGERLRLSKDSVVLDLASGRAGPAIQLARSFGCHVTCVEKSEEFHAAARRRVEEAQLQDRIELIHMDARDFLPTERRFDAAVCLGASFVWDGLPGTLDALSQAVDPAGYVVVGEPYWRTWPLPDELELEAPWIGEYVDLGGTVERLSDASLNLVAFIDSSLDDWDRYVSLHWLVGEEWLRTHGDDAGADEVRVQLDQDRAVYLRWQRDLLGWGIFVGWRS